MTPRRVTGPKKCWRSSSSCADLVRNEAGRYPVVLDDSHDMYVDLQNGDPDVGVPDRVQLFAVLAGDVETSADVLSELNDINATIGFGRVFLADRQIVVDAELLLDTLDEPELDHALQTVGVLARNVAPMLRAVFGDQPPLPSDTS